MSTITTTDTDSHGSPNSVGATFPGARTATAFSVAFLVCFGGVVTFSVLDRPKTAQLETFSETTAAGDMNWYQVPLAPLAVPDPILTWNGRPWAPASFDKVKIDDTKMLRVGHDEATGLSVYREKASPESSTRYVKIDVGEYLPLQPR